MVKKSVIILSVLLILAGPSWGLNLKPGKYEITSTVKMEGVPEEMAAQIPPQTITQCITKQDPVPSKGSGGQGCEITDMKTKGSTISYTMVCDQQGAKMNAKGSITYKGDSFEGTSKMVMGPEAGGMTIITEIKGKRISACD